MTTHPIRTKNLSFIGSHVPRRCGIATFTSDICMAVGGDGDNKVGEAEVALDTITGSKGSSGTIASAWSGWR